MPHVVFYTWQSDLPNATNRSFILKALENVAHAITIDDTVDVEPVIDRDTQGVPGAPDISKTIFQKIAAADVLVADVSIVGVIEGGRPTPNPNVLIELGYALHALGDERVVLVLNLAFGKPEELPFDLKMRRILTFGTPEQATDRATERKLLEAKLNDALRAALASINREPPSTPLMRALDATHRVAPDRVIALRQALTQILDRLTKKRPKSVGKGATIEDLEGAVLQTEEVAHDYVRLAAAVATMNDEEGAKELYRGLGPILEGYDIARGAVGTIYRADFDFMKFHGHEFLTALIACLIREERWQLAAKLLAEGIPVKYRREENGPAVLFFDEASEHLIFAGQLSGKRGLRSLHADILNARYTSDKPLGQLLSSEDFMNADYFLFLRRELAAETAPGGLIAWRPWSSLYLHSAPSFIRHAESRAAAERVAAAMSLPDAPTFRQRLAERRGRLRHLWPDDLFWRSPVSEEDALKIGTR